MNDSRKAEYETQKATNDASPAREGKAANPASMAAEGVSETAAKTSEAVDGRDSLRSENTELKDKLLRTLAEMENLRRRTDREVAEAKAYGVTTFARDMLIVADNLRRALASVPAHVREQADSAWKNLIDGIEVTERDFLSRLGKYDVKKLAPLGAKFDPNLHEALFEVAEEKAPTGTVVQIVEEGYAIGDRVLRPAKVGVSRGGPKAAAKAPNGDASA